MKDNERNIISDIDKLNLNEFNSFYKIRKNRPKYFYFLLLIVISLSSLSIIFILKIEKQKLINKFIEMNNNQLKKEY